MYRQDPQYLRPRTSHFGGSRGGPDAKWGRKHDLPTGHASDESLPEDKSLKATGASDIKSKFWGRQERRKVVARTSKFAGKSAPEPAADTPPKPSHFSVVFLGQDLKPMLPPPHLPSDGHLHMHPVSSSAMRLKSIWRPLS
jgi:hypothetical protein